MNLSSSRRIAPVPVRRGTGLLIALAVSVASVVLLVVASAGGVRLSVWLTPRPEPAWHKRLAGLPPEAPLSLAVATHGRDIFMRACAQCHAASGLGMQGLGKDLVRSDFVADMADPPLVAFIERGRPVGDPLNTTRIAMPPKGGLDSLTTEDLRAVASYLRGLQDPRRMPELPAWAPAPMVVSAAEKEAALAAAGGDEELAEYIASGDKLFHSTCIACHGKGGVGVAGNGKSLVANPFIISLDDDGLLAFVQQGRGPSDPKNTTGIQMPPKGGNPALSEDDILDIIAYLRTLQNGRAVTGGG